MPLTSLSIISAFSEICVRSFSLNWRRRLDLSALIDSLSMNEPFDGLLASISRILSSISLSIACCLEMAVSSSFPGLMSYVFPAPFTGLWHGLHSGDTWKASTGT